MLWFNICLLMMSTFLKPHGNSKGKISYKRIMPSTLVQLQASANDKTKTPKEILNSMYSALGDVTQANNLDQLPTGARQLYDARYSARSKKDQSSKVSSDSQGQSNADKM